MSNKANTDNKLTPQERIRKMRVMFNEAKERKEKAFLLREQTFDAGFDLQDELLDELRPLEGLPVKLGEIHASCHIIASYKPDSYDRKEIIYEDFYPLNIRVMTLRETMIEFRIAADFTTGEVWLEHDDTPVTVDQALDLAVAVVEAHLAIEEE